MRALVLLLVCVVVASAEHGWTKWVKKAPILKAPSELKCSDKNAQLDITHLDLDFDVQNRRGKAIISFRSCGPEVVFDANLTVTSVRCSKGRYIPYNNDRQTQKLHVQVPKGVKKLFIEYEYDLHATKGAVKPPTSPGAFGSVAIWPYYCGNVFPCHPTLRDSITYDMKVHNLPFEYKAIYPRKVNFPSPSYMLSWAVGDYSYLNLGKTDAGTQIGVYYLPGGKEKATETTKLFRGSFDWLEKNLGEYVFGPEYASVAVQWDPSESGGMEYEPFAHLEADSFGKQLHTHEAGHAWYGDGVRIACWNDFVLSEGTNSYITALALEGAGGAETGRWIWNKMAHWTVWSCRNDTTPILLKGPDVCALDILKDDIFSLRHYAKGCWFYREVAKAWSKDKLTAALASFYAKNRGKVMHMTDMLKHIDASGFDTRQLADTYLYGTGLPHYIFDRGMVDDFGWNDTGLRIGTYGGVEGELKEPFLGQGYVAEEGDRWSRQHGQQLRAHVRHLAGNDVNQANLCALIEDAGERQVWCMSDASKYAKAPQAPDAGPKPTKKAPRPSREPRKMPNMYEEGLLFN